MEDNAHPHWTAELSETPESKNIERIEGFYYSPDLNRIELSGVLLTEIFLKDLKNTLREE